MSHLPGNLAAHVAYARNGSRIPAAKLDGDERAGNLRVLQSMAQMLKFFGGCVQKE